jgi:hypothetical protein
LIPGQRNQLIFLKGSLERESFDAEFTERERRCCGSEPWQSPFTYLHIDHCKISKPIDN